MELTVADRTEDIAALASFDSLSLWRSQLNHTLMTPEYERELGCRYQVAVTEGLLDVARDIEAEFISHNVRLMYSEVLRRFHAAGRHGDLADAIQVGYEALIDAFRRWDPHLGWRFSAYAILVIRGSVSKYLYEQVSPVRVPTHQWRKLPRMAEAREEFAITFGRSPSDEELADYTNSPPSSIRRTAGAGRLIAPLSLDRPLTSEPEADLLGSIQADPLARSPESIVEQMDMRDCLSDALDRVLTPSECRIVRLHYGLDDEPPRTMDWIARRLGISRQRVHQILQVALPKLKSDPRLAGMFDRAA